MKTYRVPKPCDPGKLHQELQAAGVPVITVRGGHAKVGEPAMFAVVVTEDKTDKATVEKVVAKHKCEGKPSRALSPKEMEAALKQREKL